MNYCHECFYACRDIQRDAPVPQTGDLTQPRWLQCRWGPPGARGVFAFVQVTETGCGQFLSRADVALDAPPEDA
jgi:hypothetical protein